MRNLKILVLLTSLCLLACSPDDEPYFELDNDEQQEIIALIGDTITIYGKNFIESFKPNPKAAPNISIFLGNKSAFRGSYGGFTNLCWITELEDNFIKIRLPRDEARLINKKNELIFERRNNPSSSSDIEVPKIRSYGNEKTI